MNKRNKWKTVRNITLAVLILFVILIAIIGIGFLTDTGMYPDPNGLTRLRSFEAVLKIIIAAAGIPMLADLGLLMISLIKIKKK